MKKALSWLALVFGVGLSIVLLGLLGIIVDTSRLGGGDWLKLAGLAVLASLPMAASLLAIRHRRLAAWIFLTPAPILGMFAAYIEAIDLAWAYGGKWPGS